MGKLLATFANLNVQLQTWAENPTQYIERLMKALKGHVFAVNVLHALSAGERRSIPEIHRDIDGAIRGDVDVIGLRHAYRIVYQLLPALVRAPATNRRKGRWGVPGSRPYVLGAPPQHDYHLHPTFAQTVLSDHVGPNERRTTTQLAKRLTYSRVYRETLTNTMRYAISLVTAENFPTFVTWTKTRFPLLYRRLPVTVKDATPNMAKLRSLSNIIPDELVDRAMPSSLTLFGEPLPWEEARRINDLITRHTSL
jgi:hypothetical protein